MKTKTRILDLFDAAKAEQSYLKVCAPMVRYSKVQFRTLVRNFGVDLCFTPMILADSFCQNEKARLSEFATTLNDSPLVVQFAANNSDDFVDATKLVLPYADGVDLNCGCPQAWAMKGGYGCALLSKPELIYDLVRGVRNHAPNTFSVSVKIRLLKDLQKTTGICRQLEMCGVDFLTVHGRTPAQKSSGSVDVEALRQICLGINVPIVANGGVKTLEDADELHSKVNCNGVMVASALLSNPALFSGAHTTPRSCVQLWMDMKNLHVDKITFQCYHHHLVFMLDKVLTKSQKSFFNSLNTFDSVDEYLLENVLNDFNGELNVKHEMADFVTCSFADDVTIKHSSKCRGCARSICYCICLKYDCNATDGKYYNSYVKDDDALDYMNSNIFEESS